jgi:alcohol dehydrogenase
VDAAGFLEFPSSSDTLVQIPEPSARGGQLLIDVKAASINPIDLAIREGYGREVFNSIHPDTPFVTGCDASGIVADVSGGSWDFKVGDPVVVAIRPSLRGTHATRIAVSETCVALKPKNLDFVQSAAFPFAWCTALSAASQAVCLLFEFVAPRSSDRESLQNVREGMHVLIHGGSGAIGTSSLFSSNVQSI